MGTVIRFPDERRMASKPCARTDLLVASIIILPVVRIERHADGAIMQAAPEAGSTGGGGRRRPGRRS